MQQLEITIHATVPDGDEEKGHDARIAARDHLNAAVQVITEHGLTVTENRRRVVARRPRDKAVAEKASETQETVEDTEDLAAD